MMKYNNLKQRPRHFLSFTDLTVAEFDKFVKDNRQDWHEQRIQRLLKNNPIENGKSEEAESLLYQPLKTNCF